MVVSGAHFFETRRDIVVAAISSRPAVGPFEIPLLRWSEAGLRFPSKVMVGKLITVNASLVVVLGSLVQEDLESVRSRLPDVFDL